MKVINPNISSSDKDKRVSPPVEGCSFGLLIMRSWNPKPIGHVSQLSSYEYPVVPDIVEGSNFDRILGGDLSLVPNIVEAAKRLQDMGCKAITSSCGYFGRFQQYVADALDVPVYISSVLQIPFVLSGLSEDKKVIVLCYDDSRLIPPILDACGLTEKDKSRIVIQGMVEQPNCGLFQICPGHYDVDEARNELVRMAVKMQKENPDAAAIVLECTDMPPHAAAVQKATNLPVFDITTLMDLIDTVVS